MAYICDRPSQPCSGCEHYRYDDDYGGKICFGEQDAMTVSAAQTSKTEHQERTE